jgi:hypothetical protein
MPIRQEIAAWQILSNLSLAHAVWSLRGQGRAGWPMPVVLIAHLPPTFLCVRRAVCFGEKASCFACIHLSCPAGRADPSHLQPLWFRTTSAKSQPNPQLYLMCCVSLPAMKQHTLFVWCVCLQHHCWGGVPGYGERDHILLQGRAWHEFALNLGDCCSGRSSGRTK